MSPFPRRLAKDPSYQTAKADEVRLLAALNEARKSNDPAAKLQASSAWSKARLKVAEWEKTTLDLDPAVAEARKGYAAEVEREKADVQRNAQAEAEIHRAAEAILNPPIVVAIREHRLIEGMTYEQAVQAIGKPYSVTKSGDSASATWEVSEGEFWSAVFVDGKATSITHTRL